MFIPLAMIAGFALLGFLMFPRMKRAVRESGRIRSERHAFLVEMLSEMRAIKQTGSEAVWAQRYRNLSAAAASGGFATAMATAVIENVSQMLMTLAGASVLVVGAVLAAEGELSIGALIAIMALIWRILGPIKSGFTLMHAAEQTMASIAQLNAVLGYTSEKRGDTGTERKVFSGRIAFQHVVFRHPGSVEPSLFNVSIDVQPGELVAVAGRSGIGQNHAAAHRTRPRPSPDRCDPAGRHRLPSGRPDHVAAFVWIPAPAGEPLLRVDRTEPAARQPIGVGGGSGNGFASRQG